MPQNAQRHRDYAIALTALLGAGRDFREHHVSEVPAPIAIELSSATICPMGIIYEEFSRAVRTVNRSGPRHQQAGRSD